jgi:hypothetical protein
VTDPYRLLVTGSRTWADRDLLARQLAIAVSEGRLTGRDVTVVHGAASGADAMAGQWAAGNGVAAEPHPADWGRHGRSAGYRRNELMVSLGADVMLAFLMPCMKARCQGRGPHPTHGAGDCVAKAEAAGIKVRRFRP